MNNDVYKTPDIYLVAALQTIGFPVVKVGVRDTDAKKQAVFYINTENSNKNYIKGLNEFVGDYYANKLELPAFELLNTLRQLKSRMYAEIGTK